MEADVSRIPEWDQLVQHAPDALAVVEAATARRWSRLELDELARERQAQMPTNLLGRRVVFAQPNGAAWLATFIALQRQGAVAVPLDPTETEAAQERLAVELRATLWWRDDRWVALPRAHRARPPAPFLIKLTSGSSGTPRALLFTAAEMIADGRNVCRTMGIGSDDLNLAIIPFGHSYGLGNLVMPLLIQGTAIVIGSSPLPRVLAEDVARWRPTVFPAVPALLRLLAFSDVAAEDVASLRTVISAGAPLPVEVAHAFRSRFGRAVHGFYGSTETGGICYDRTGEATLTGRSVGPPLEGVTLQFDHGGRFWVQSAAVFRLGNRHRLPEGGARHRPADTAALNDQGELVLHGRSGRMVKIDGRRLDLTELEHALRRIDGIIDAYVIPHAKRGDTLAAALHTALPEPEVRARLGQHLAAWRIPRRLVCLSEFPLTARGKPDLATLRHLLAS